MSMQNDEERPSFAVVIPAYNEAESVGGLITEIIERYPAVRIIVVNDGSVDETTMVARMNGAEVLELP